MIKRIEEQGVKRMVGYRGEDGATVNRSGSIWLIKLASSLRRGTSYVHGLCELTLLREWPRLILPSIPRLNTPSLNLSAREREIRRFARGWMTLVVDILFQSWEGGKNIYSKRRTVERSGEREIICFCVPSAILSAGNLDQGRSSDVKRREWNFVSVIWEKVQWDDTNGSF